MLNELYEPILVDWLNSYALVITDKWELVHTESAKSIAVMFAEFRNRGSHSPEQANKRRSFFYRLTHPHSRQSSSQGIASGQHFTPDTQEEESRKFVVWFQETYKSIESKEKLLENLRFDRDQFQRVIFQLHEKDFSIYLSISKSGMWTKALIDRVILKLSDNYNKYLNLYSNERKDLIKRRYFMTRILALQSFASEDGYAALVHAIRDLVDMIETGRYTSKTACIESNPSHSLNVLLLLGVCYENISAEENFYASIHLLRMLSSKDNEQLKVMLSDFNDYFIENVNIDSNSYDKILSAKKDTSPTLEAYAPAINDACNTLINTMNGCSLFEVQKMLSDDLPDDIRMKSQSRRSPSHSGIYEGLLTGFVGFGRRSQSSSVSSGSSSSSSRSLSPSFSSRKSRIERQ